ncbi:MAG: PspA/IM30 family protein [Ruminococcus flavefaciens]|nr:PspA/IM30 family protein [Ruminococcus flavefaciens]
MAGIFDRMSMIVKSNVNELIDKFEDPEKIVDQSIIEAKEELAKVKKSSLPTLANEEMVKKQLDAEQKEVARWHGIAAAALKAGNEADAAKALEEEGRHKSKAESLGTSYEAARKAADALREQISLMEKEIAQMQDKAAQIKATAATAKATKAAAQVTSRTANRGGFDAFARMEEKANRQLAEAEALKGLESGGRDTEAEDLAKKYSAGGSASTADAMEALKKEVFGG